MITKRLLTVSFTVFLMLTKGASAEGPNSKKSHGERAAEAKRGLDLLDKAWMDFAEMNRQGEMQPESTSFRLQAKLLRPEELKATFAGASGEFMEPEVVRSINGVLKVTLNVAMAHHKIGGVPVYLRSYNAKLVGPTLRCQPGDKLLITVVNNLDKLPVETFQPDSMNHLETFNTTNLHTHGLHVSPSGISDNVLLQIPPGAAQRYEINLPKDHPAGTFWYHAHKHGSTAGNVGSGMSGALIIEGGLDQVPEIAQAQDRTFVLQQIPYVMDDVDGVQEGVVELKFANQSFGPKTWDTLKLYTTINGQKLPIIKMRPGSMERWRFVDSAVREVIQPELVRIDHGKSKAPSRLLFQEIANDGLALGRIAPRTVLELWPGYRSDVLVQAPSEEGAVYVLRDTRVPAKGQTYSEDRRYLALIVVEGSPQSSQLPASGALAKFRLPSIAPQAVTAHQLAAYGIINTSAGVHFTIDRTPFDDDRSRLINLDEVHEWTVISRNNVGPVSHPFHIHVNPFEVFSMTNEEGEETLDKDADGKVLPVWRDTIILHEQWKVMFRTAYTDFPGTYVQHCHILDHEDQGMMELVEIVPPPPPAPPAATADASMQPKRVVDVYPAPVWELPNAAGKMVSLSEYVDRPTVVFFFEGFGCLRCNEQLQELIAQAEEFTKSGCKIIGITTDDIKSLAEGSKNLSLPFPLVADPALRAFRAYGCSAAPGMPLHGMFVLDAKAQVHWQVVSSKPYLDLARVRQEAQLLVPSSPKVSITR